jgi:hypothetical protein
MVLDKLHSKLQVQTFKNGKVIANQVKLRAHRKLVSNSDYDLDFIQISQDKAVHDYIDCIK